MRFVSQQVTNCLGGTVPPQANFGLIFNKWLDYRENRGKLEPVVSRDRSDLVLAAKNTKKAAGKVLEHHHTRQAEFCLAMQRSGWLDLILHARLVSPFVSGLGMHHPTETGMVLDHTSGMPYVPAASQKGVFRLGHILTSLQDEQGNWRDQDELLDAGIIDSALNWLGDREFHTLYGMGGDREALAGQLTILDAYPLEPPELSEDILNPHYNDYYQKKRGPTEDQQPVPVKFMVVRPGAEFVFRVLLRPALAKAPSKKDLIALRQHALQAITHALVYTGLGAKTALGMGRFAILSDREPQLVRQWLEEKQTAQQQAEKERRMKQEDKKYPWRKVLRKTGQVDNWGDLRTRMLENETLQEFQAELEVGRAVQEAAQKIKKHLSKKQKKKWQQEQRDQVLAEWLEPSGITWEVVHAEKQASQAAAKTASSDQEIWQQIRELDEFSKWQQLKTPIKKLDLASAEALMEKFQKWKLGKSKKKPEKKAFKDLKQRITNLKKAS